MLLLSSIITVLASSVISGPVFGICDQETNECLINLSRLTSFSQCGMPPSNAATSLDHDTLDWGFCACPKLVPIFDCFHKANGNCPGAKQYIHVYGDQVEKGCKVIDWAIKKTGTKKVQFGF